LTGIDFKNHRDQSDRNNVSLISSDHYINVKKTLKIINTFNIFGLTFFFETTNQTS